MILSQALALVRVGLNEATPRFWTNSEIIGYLNEGAGLMCSETKCLTGIWQTVTAEGEQEYVMPDDMIEAYNVLFAQGTVLPIKPLQEATLKIGIQTLGMPLWCYFRVGTLIKAQLTSTPDIRVTQISGNTGRRKPKIIIGLYPVPQSEQQLTVQYYARHYTMIADTDEFAVPDEYMRGVVAYAIALGKQKEQDMASFGDQMGVFKEFKDRMLEDMANNGQLINFPRMKIRGNDYVFDGTSWVYVGNAGYQGF